MVDRMVLGVDDDNFGCNNGITGIAVAVDGRKFENDGII